MTKGHWWAEVLMSNYPFLSKQYTLNVHHIQIYIFLLPFRDGLKISSVVRRGWTSRLTVVVEKTTTCQNDTSVFIWFNLFDHVTQYYPSYLNGGPNVHHLSRHNKTLKWIYVHVYEPQCKWKLLSLWCDCLRSYIYVTPRRKGKIFHCLPPCNHFHTVPWPWPLFPDLYHRNSKLCSCRALGWSSRLSTHLSVAFTVDQNICFTHNHNSKKAWGSRHSWDLGGKKDRAWNQNRNK